MHGYCEKENYFVYLYAEKGNVMKWLFKTIVDGVVNTCYEFDSKEKADRWQENYIKDMKKIGCYPLKGLELKVEQA